MKVLAELTFQDGGKGYVFFCPGCGFYHNFQTVLGTDTTRPIWEFNGDLEKPTFSPSLGIFMEMKIKRCHSFVIDGQIQYLSDSFHNLRGQTIPLKEIEW